MLSIGDTKGRCTWGCPFCLEPLKLLCQRPQHDLVDAHIGRLLNGEDDGAGNRVGGDGLFVELIPHLAAGFVAEAVLEFAIHHTCCER